MEKIQAALEDFLRVNPRLQKKLSFDEKRSLIKMIDQLSELNSLQPAVRSGTEIELKRMQAKLAKVTEEKEELENYIRRKDAIRKSTERGSAIVSDIRSRRESTANEQKANDISRLEREISAVKGESYDKDVSIKGLKKEIELYTSILTLIENMPKRELLLKFTEERRTLYREDYIVRLRQEILGREKDVKDLIKKANDLKTLRNVLLERQACIRL